MAVGPDGVSWEPEPGGMADDEVAGFVRGLEAAIDRTLARHPRGRPFAFGNHQELSEAVAARLVERYRAAGWPSVRIRPTETGAHLLVLGPVPSDSDE
jgi:hypothetical protein